jgi:predicted short-subunit dehydrogenase-like oxidoreductase (DUF2520 family)
MANRKRPSVSIKRPSVSIIGSGRLGTALGLALTSAGYSLEALVARRRQNAKRAAKQLDVRALALAETELDELPASGLIIIATPDDAIAQVAKELAQVHTSEKRRRVVLHTSGALSSEVLAPLAAKGFAIGSLHPLIAVSDRTRGVPKWKGAFWCIEGDRLAVATASGIVRDLDGQSFSVRSDSKALYHAAALMVSGQMVALFDIAIGMLSKAGLDSKKAREILLPLVQSNSRNLERFDSAHALTGTFARGDLATVKRHLQALSSRDLDTARAVYQLLGIRSLELAEETNGNHELLTKVKKLLKDS